MGWASGEVVDQHAPIIEFSHGEARTSVLMRRASSDPATGTSLAHCLQAVQKYIDTHLALLRHLRSLGRTIRLGFAKWHFAMIG